MSLPVLYLAFANNPAAPLANLTREARDMEKALQRVENGLLQLKKDEFATLDAISQKLRDYHNRVVLLHYGGHADGQTLLLSDGEAADGRGIAALLQAQKHLKLVFLNGCSTRGQVKRLLELGIPAVLATATPVGDEQATEVAQLFYEALAGGMSIGEAFGHLEGYYTAGGNAGLLGRYRGAGFQAAAGEDPEALPWGLYYADEKALAWRLADASVLYSFNQQLSRRLMDALNAQGNRLAAKFLEWVQAKGAQNANWETEAVYSDQAKDLVASCFVGVLGIQLRKINAIGKESPGGKKQEKYIENCLITALKVLQLLCYVLVSKLWDHAKDKPPALSPEQAALLKAFFQDAFEHDIQGYLQLLQALLAIYRENGLELPIPEMEPFAAALREDQRFAGACSALQNLWTAWNNSNHSLSQCYEAETLLIDILEATLFFARYKMVSIKSIDYDEMRGNPPRYLHRYAALEIDRKTNQYTEAVNYVADPVSTDAVLLFKGRYQESVNLFPFIIDLNALTFEGGAKICFFGCRDLNDGSLNYRFLEDNSVQNIVFQNILQETPDLNKLMQDAGKRKQLKLDVVCQQFRDAEKTLLGESADLTFDDFFTGEELSP